MSVLRPYFLPIISSAVIFPFIVFLISLPFAVYCYRRFGRLSVLRTIIIYSFIFYVMCAFFLTALPLPPRDKVAAMARIHINWIPFSNFYRGICTHGFDPKNLGSILSLALWKRYLNSSEFFQILANVIMLIPFGMYLRYYFQCSRKKTIFLSFLLSLFFELTQLSGLFFIYSQPYRCPDINDLMTNTLGGWIGYAITPLFLWILPTREEMDQLPAYSSEHASIVRRGVALWCDWVMISVILGIISAISDFYHYHKLVLSFQFQYTPAVFVLYFGILQWIMKGQTPGKKLLHLKAVNYRDHAKSPEFWDYLKRYAFIYLVIPFVGMMDLLFLAATAIACLNDVESIIRILGIIATVLSFGCTFGAIFYTEKKARLLPHDYIGKMEIIQIQ